MFLLYIISSLFFFFGRCIAIFSGASYMGELIRSFFQYVPMIAGLGCVVSVVFSISAYFAGVFYRKLCSIVLGCLFFAIAYHASGWISSIYMLYYSPSAILGSVSQDKATISILYANIYYANTQYTGLLDLVRIHNPDVVMFVEYDSGHLTNMSPILDDMYPYKNRYTGKNKYEGDIIYSRLPLTIYPTKTNSGWSYNHICQGSSNIDVKKSCLVDTLLVHTTAPIDPKHLMSRNNQLSRLTTDISLIKKTYKPKTMGLVLGDMNISPRSTAYGSMQKSFESQGFTDVSLGISPRDGTWSSFSLPSLHSHIDHIWTNKSARIRSMQHLEIHGSDHDGLFFTLSL